ncbi:MAG TPA: transglutaminase family protein [Edaphocola sp.]|nr:transglutaminase family protein [Edaphocola sp.]
MTLLQNEKEVIALMRLIDDPDLEIFEMVSQKLLTYGTGIIPKLEQLWGFTDSSIMTDRIEYLIHQIYFQQLQTELIKWTQNSAPSLLEAGILIAKYRYPDLDKELILHQFELMRRNIWLELNNSLSPLEQINIVNSIVFNFFRFKGHELSELNPEHFFLNKTIDNKHGNAYTIGIIYLSLCEQLDIPIFAIDLPHQFVMAYFEHNYSFMDLNESNAIQQLQLFIDPINGIVYNKKDIETFLIKNEQPEKINNLKALDKNDFFALMLKSLSHTYYETRAFDLADEIESLIILLNKG